MEIKYLEDARRFMKEKRLCHFYDRNQVWNEDHPRHIGEISIIEITDESMAFQCLNSSTWYEFISPVDADECLCVKGEVMPHPRMNNIRLLIQGKAILIEQTYENKEKNVMKLLADYCPICGRKL